MSTDTELLYFLLALCLSLVASVVLARDIDRLGVRLGLPEPVLGLLAALGADSPEISAAIGAMQSGHRNMGAAVVLGSNLFNLAALMGLSAVVAGPVRLGKPGLVVEAGVALSASTVAAAIVLGGLPAPAGLGALGAVFVPYVALISIRPGLLRSVLPAGRSRDFLLSVVATSERDSRGAERAPKARKDDLFSAVPALVSVVIASLAMVRLADGLGQRFQVSDTVMGMLVLAPVTGVPNVVAALRLARRSRGAAVVSESFNSNSINVVVGLIIPGLISGYAVSPAVGRIGAVWLVLLTLTTAVLTYAQGGLRRVDGAVVIGSYLVFVGLVVVY